MGGKSVTVGDFWECWFYEDDGDDEEEDEDGIEDDTM